MRRPSRYSEKLACAIIERVASGESLKSVCADPRMPDKRTVLHWADKDVDGFRTRYALAMDFRAQGIFDDMLEIADSIEPGKRVKKNHKGTEVTIGDMVERSKLRIDTRKWILARMSPKRYGEKITQEISGPDGGPVKTESDFRPTPADENFLKRAAEARMRLIQEHATTQPNEQTS